ncbi:MAG: hypothetical protein ACR2P0_01805, partial [Acidimicrobiales bacterium]
FYGVDPILVNDPMVALESPSLLSAYSYAANNPATLVDVDGQAGTFNPRNLVYDADRPEVNTPLLANSKRLASITTLLKFNFSDGELERFRLVGIPLVDRRSAGDGNQGVPPGANQGVPADNDSSTSEDESSQIVFDPSVTEDGVDVDDISISGNSANADRAAVDANVAGDDSTSFDTAEISSEDLGDIPSGDE